MLLLLGLAVRLPVFAWPLWDVVPARQAHTASVARTFWRSGIDLLRPRIDDLPEPRVRVQGLPLYEAGVALLYRLVGGVREGAARAFSASLAVLAAVCLWGLSKPIHGAGAAWICAAILLFAPASILHTRTVQHDALALCLAVGGVSVSALGLARRSVPLLFLSAGTLALAGMVKLPMASAIAPVLWIGLIDRESRLRRAAAVSTAGALGAVVAWVLYARWAGTVWPTRYADADVARWFVAPLLAEPGFYADVLDLATGAVLTPIVAGLAMVGLLLPAQEPRERMAHVWFAAAAAALLVFPLHARTHAYYHLAILPPVAMLSARALCACARIGGLQGWIPRALLAALFLLPSLARVREETSLPPDHALLPSAARAVHRWSMPSDRIVAAGVPGPAFLYLCDRKGRGIDVPPGLERGGEGASWRRMVEEERREGATLLIAIGPATVPGSAFRLYCAGAFRLLEHRPGRFSVYRMGEGIR
ncbi:MAG: glycosyltransferase family 39 protein [Planctomycetes bacterium]|nr:glycosyltransferase family 39 protein [Planctomycetota bacterium]